MAKEEKKSVGTEQPNAPLTVADVKVNSVAEAAGRIARGEKVRHPGPWVKITPRAGFSLEEEVIALQKDKKLKGYDPKTACGIFV